MSYSNDNKPTSTYSGDSLGFVVWADPRYVWADPLISWADPEPVFEQYTNDGEITNGLIWIDASGAWSTYSQTWAQLSPYGFYTGDSKPI